VHLGNPVHDRTELVCAGALTRFGRICGRRYRPQSSQTFLQKNVAGFPRFVYHLDR
jgi:hypothetical protein